MQTIKRQKKALGFILHEDALRVVIATMKSENGKTGNMVQVWILHREVNPVQAIKTGADAAICGNCPLRLNASTGKRDCYVNVGQAPRSVFSAYKRGIYPKWDGDTSPFTGRKIRWGAYGDPVFIPFPTFQAISRASAGFSGYTHQWRNPLFRPFRAFLMASADSMEDAQEAWGAGWRTFRVSDTPAKGEILCVSESKGKTCDECLLCCGSSKRAKSIFIPAHGSGRKAHPSVN
jgi:hypothetical protein